MGRMPASFKRSDVIRAINAAMACGLIVSRTEISPDGRIILDHTKKSEANAIENELDNWRAMKNARSA